MFNEIAADYLQTIQTQQWDAVCVTINTVIKADGSLVMGAGTAAVIAAKFPQVPAEFGRIIKAQRKYSPTHTFPAICTFYTPTVIGMPTKVHYSNKSTLELVERSLKQLGIIVNTFGYERVLLPKPGCALGGLSWSKEVRPLCEELLDKRYWIIGY
jgi:hypothetical protein